MHPCDTITRTKFLNKNKSPMRPYRTILLMYLKNLF